MELRIFRTFDWVIAVPASEVLLGGRNPMKLKHADELQWRPVTGFGEWRTVPIVEADKPEHPDEKDARVRNEETQAAVDRMIADGTIKFPNAEVSGAGTASAGLPGSAANSNYGGRSDE